MKQNHIFYKPRSAFKHDWQYIRHLEKEIERYESIEEILRDEVIRQGKLLEEHRIEGY